MNPPTDYIRTIVNTLLASDEIMARFKSIHADELTISLTLTAPDQTTIIVPNGSKFLITTAAPRGTSTTDVTDVEAIPDVILKALQ